MSWFFVWLCFKRERLLQTRLRPSMVFIYVLDGAAGAGV